MEGYGESDPPTWGIFPNTILVHETTADQFFDPDLRKPAASHRLSAIRWPGREKSSWPRLDRPRDIQEGALAR